MAEAILFPLAGKILSTLSPLLLDEISLPWFAKKELRKLEEKITTIRNVLIHAQEQQKRNDAVKDWLRRLKNILYEADDLFDGVATEALRQEIVINKNIMRKVRHFFISSNPLLFHYNLGGKIQEIRERLDEICNDMRDFSFLVQTLDKPIIKRNENDTDFRQTISLINVQTIVGREDDKTKLLELLLSSSDHENVHVIPIVGMGGLGKTTLAQMIFNDYTLNYRFDKKLWVCVSDDFNIKGILTDILTTAGENVTKAGMEQLQILFQEKLSGKKFFLVLDDVWNDNPVEWKKLEVLLMTGARGSRILVTTRDKKVAKIVNTMEPYELKGLSEEECLSILVKWAFEKGKETNYPNLIEIGREIVKKCGGVPLAARTLGVLLFSKTSRHEWLLVKDSEMWDQVQNENDIIPILKLSYDQMPSSLKECFVYCSLFQKDEEIKKEKLMYHWIANGFIQSPNRNVELEDVCETYLDELLRRSFLEYVGSNNAYKKNDMIFYKMHDLVHDLATYIVGDEILILKKEYVSAASHKVRYVSLAHSSKIPKSLRKEKFLRTIISRGELTISEKFIFGTLIKEKLLHNRCLRVLDYVDAKEYRDLPKFIGKAKYLRYLCIHDVTTIPESLCELLNLQYLDLCSSFIDTIPENFGNLRKLRVLRIEFAPNLICLPEGIQSLTSLRTLMINYAPMLRSLGYKGLGCITSLEHLEILSCYALEFSDSDFQGLTSLKYLILSYLFTLKELPIGLQDAAATLKHMSLRYCLNLKLTEEVLPNLSSLEVLEIDHCPMITCLPEGIRSLTSLRKLKIHGCWNLRSLGTGLGCITSLELLEIGFCKELEFSNSDFQGLKSLKILELLRLPKLKQLPTGLQDAAGTLKHLELWGCDHLTLVMGTSLRCITSLEHLGIYDCFELEFSNSDFQGLTSLKYLVLSNLPGLKQLPTGLQDAATTLKHLELKGCSNLKLTEEVLPNLTSLEVLKVEGCSRITCLPEGMQSLGKLYLLEIGGKLCFRKRCTPTGEDWPKISHVPHIIVNREDVRSS